jgi:hypothetical protein
VFLVCLRVWHVSESGNVSNNSFFYGLHCTSSAHSQLVSKYQRHLYSHLSSTSRQRNAAACSLLAGIGCRGRAAAWELVRHLDWSLPAFAKLGHGPRHQDTASGADVAKKGSGHGTQVTQPLSGRSTRGAMVALTLALLSHVDGALRRALLGGPARKVLMQALWRGLASDAVPDVCAVLGALRDNVLATSSGVPPRLQAAVLTDAAIDALVTISASAAPEMEASHEGGQQAPLTMADAKRHADAILTALVMDPAHGFVPDTLAAVGAVSQGAPAGPAAHRSLSRVLRVMRRLRVTEVPHHCDMVLTACEARPQLAGAYLGEPPYGLEPRVSAKWLAAITMTSRLIRIAVTSPHLLAWTATPSTAAAGSAASALCRSLFPLVLTRGALTRALGADAAPVVRYAAVLTLLACLRSMGDVMQATRRQLSTSTSASTASAWLLFREAVRDAARDALPDPQTLVALILSDGSVAGAGVDEHMASAPHLAQAGGTKRKRDADADADAEHDGDDARGIEHEPAPADLRAQAMRALAHFRRLVPGAFAPGGAASRLDPTRLLPSVGGSLTLAGAWQQVQSCDEADVAASLDVMLAFTLGSGDVTHADQEDGASADHLAGDDDAAAGLGSGGSGRDAAPGHVAMLAMLVQRHGDGHVPDDVAALSERLLRLRCVAAGATSPAASLAAEEAQALLWIRALPPASCPGSAAVTSFFAEGVAACARRAAQQQGDVAMAGPGLCPLASVALDSALKVGASAKRGFVDRLAVCCYVACATTAMMAAQSDVAGAASAVSQALRSLDQVACDAQAPHGVVPLAPLMALRRTAAVLCGSVDAASEEDAGVSCGHLLEAALKAHRKARKSRASDDMAGDVGDGQLESAVVLATLFTCSARDLRTAPPRVIARAAAAVGAGTLVWTMPAMPHMPLLDAAATSQEGSSAVSQAISADHVSLFALLPACAGAACDADDAQAQALCAAAWRVPPLLRQPAVNALCCWLERARTASAARALLAACVALVLDGGNIAGGAHGVHWAAAQAALSHPWLCGRYLHTHLGDSSAAAMTQASAEVSAATDAGTTELVAAVFPALDAASAAHSTRLAAVQSAAEACACRVARALCLAAGSTAPSPALHGAAVALFARTPAEEQHAALQVLVPERMQAAGHMSQEWRALGATLAEQALLRTPGAHVVAGTVATWRGMLAAAQALPGGAAEGAAVRVAASWPAACAVTSTAALFASCLADPTAHRGAAAQAIAALCASSVAHQSALCASLVDADVTHWRSVALPLLSAMTCVLQAAASQQAPSADASALAARLQPPLMAHFGVAVDGAEGVVADGVAAQALRLHGHAALVATLALAPPAKAVRQQLANALLPAYPNGWLRPDAAAAASPTELCRLAFALAAGDGALKKAKMLRVRSLHVAMTTTAHLWSCDAVAAARDASLEATLVDALTAHVRWASREPGALVEPVLALCEAVLRHRSSIPAACDLAMAYVTQLATQCVDQPAWATGVRRLFDECACDDALLAILQNAAAVPPQLPATARRCAVPLQSLLPLLDAMDSDSAQSAPPDDTADNMLARERKRSVAALLAALLSAGATDAAPLAAPWVPGKACAGGLHGLSRRLLCCYHATCDPADVAVHQLVRLLDPDGSTAASLGHLWGSAAEYALRVSGTALTVSSDLVGLALREIAPPDARRAGLAALAASVWPPAASSQGEDDDVAPTSPPCAHACDSRVVLPAAAQWLATGAMNVRDACAWGLLPLALAALSCGHDATRGASYAVLAAASEALQRGVGAGVGSQAVGNVVIGVFREQPQVGALLFAVRNAVSAPLHRFPGSAALFAAEACCVALHPEARLYSRASRAVLKSEALDLECLPLVAPLLHSGDADTWKADSLDACRLVRAYVRTATDGDLARRGFILESLMALVTSSMADVNTARESMQALTACLGVATYAVHGVDHSGVVPWLARLIATTTDATLATTAARALVDVLMVHPGIRLRAGDALAGVFSQAAAALERRATDASTPAGDVLACAAMRMYRHLLACRVEVEHQGDGAASVDRHAARLVPFPRLLALLRTLPATVAPDALRLVTDTVPTPTWRCGPADAAAFAGVVCWAVTSAGQVQKEAMHQNILAWAAMWLGHASVGAALASSGHARDVALALLALHTALPPSLRHAPGTAAPLVASLAALAQAVGVPDAYAPLLVDAHGEALVVVLSALISFWSGSSAPDDALDALRTWQARVDSAPGGETGQATAALLLAQLSPPLSAGRKTHGKRSRGNVE